MVITASLKVVNPVIHPSKFLCSFTLFAVFSCYHFGAKRRIVLCPGFLLNPPLQPIFAPQHPPTFNSYISLSPHHTTMDPPTTPISPDTESSSSTLTVSDSSKREYLLAQIRQKDAVIESLLKQVSQANTNTYLRTTKLCGD